MCRSLFAISLIALFALAHSQTLQIYQASVSGPFSTWPAGPVLPSAEITLCPDELPSPFTVVCFPPDGVSVSSVKFYVNGQPVRTERVAPYVLTGDTATSGAFPWTNPPEVSEITCRLSGGHTVTSTVRFSCSADATVATQAPTTMPPTTMPPTTMPPTTMPAEMNSRSSDASGCVYLPTTGYDEKTGAWVEGGGGMEYRFNDDSTKIDQAGVATMTYSFVAPLSTRFAITVDMLTSHGTEHNDIWLEIEGVPFTLVKSASTRAGKSGMNKAYHNRNGRSKTVYTVDFDAHVFSTTNALVAGQRYTVKIGGRSTKVRVYAIIMFPCEAFQCAPGGAWNAAMNSCSA